MLPFFNLASMPNQRITPTYIAAHIRRVLQDGGSAPHSAEVQWFFKEEIKSRGWYTAELRKVAVRFRRTLLKELGRDFLLQVADKLFSGKVLEEKVFAVFLLQTLTEDFSEAEFRLFESWLDRISSWADHDALVIFDRTNDKCPNLRGQKYFGGQIATAGIAERLAWR